MIHPCFTICPDVFQFHQSNINVTRCSEDNLEETLPEFLKTVGEDNIVGLAPIYGKKCRLSSLAMASNTQVLVILMSAKVQPIHHKKTRHKALPKPRQLLKDFLCNSTISKYAFQMDKLAAALYFDFNLPLTRGKDLLSVSTERRHTIEAYFGALGGERTLNSQAVKKLFRNEETDRNEPKTLALQAWAAYSTARFPDMACLHEAVPTIDTADFDPYLLALVAKTIRNSSCRVAIKPTRIKNDVQTHIHPKSGKLVVTSERYKTRVLRPSGNQFINIMAEQSDGTLKAYRGRASKVTGRTAILEVNGNIARMPVQTMETIGRECPTSAETLKDGYMLDILQRKLDLSTYPFVSALFFPYRVARKTVPASPSWKMTPALPPPPSINFPGSRSLNDSQTKAVNKVLSKRNANRVVLIHGPPGTGKTTVIAACVTSIMASSNKKSTVWLVAQSNVAVKNMAEKLASVGFIDFKILVSKDFHFDWHEHLYEKIESNIIRSDEFIDEVVATERQLIGSRVILCTLSTLSNDKMSTIARLVPLQTVIFDEASQIEIGDYFPMLLRFHSTLSRLVFIGDNKQLAPHGASDISTLDSIFEKAHLTERAVFLDTQYRMPTPLGSFISKHVYKGRLKSQHPITDPQSCRFVDVGHGFEEPKGYSWQNTHEVSVAIAVAKQLTTSNKSFRIITPYDPQRSLLENGLKQAKLPWKDKCFNIDAFQGNEDDYIIISLVRSSKLGFLNDPRRVNVMLTRCKKGLIICANRRFLEGPAADSLVGKLLQSSGESPWVVGREVQHAGIRPFS